MEKNNLAEKEHKIMAGRRNLIFGSAHRKKKRSVWDISW